MDSTSIIILIAIVAIAGFFFLRRNRPAAAGTYDDPKTRSSGSIGGGPRAHDDEKVRSGGSIGGGARSNDDAAHASGGGIGGQRTSDTANTRRPADDDGFDDEPNDRPGVNEPRYNDPDVKSRGTIGSP